MAPPQRLPAGRALTALARRSAGAVRRLRGDEAGDGTAAGGTKELIHHLYRSILGRDADPAGLASMGDALARGVPAHQLAIELARSEEYRTKVVNEQLGVVPLQELRPERYEMDRTVTDGSPALTFVAAEPGDFDWLEGEILGSGYYERTGVWSWEVDRDKRLLAEMLAAFAPERLLDVGCANGPLLAALADAGVEGDGIDISELAVRRAIPAVRDRIIIGDLLTTDLGRTYDVVVGLDIFEHFNPNRLDAYLQRVADLVAPSGYVVANIPAFGDDPAFGTVFPLAFADWQRDEAANLLFHRLHVDAWGFPDNGHLVWAGWRWWTDRFAAAGLERVAPVEAALHERYDDVINSYSPARRALFVFSPAAAAGAHDRVVARVRQLPDELPA